MSLDLGGEAPCYAHLFPPPALADGAAAALLYDLSDSVVIWNADCRIVFWNDASERLFGWPADEVLDRTFDVVMPDEHGAQHWRSFLQVLESASAEYSTELFEVPAVHRDGRRLSISFTVTPVRYDGLVSGTAAVIRDETERWNQRRRLQQRVAILDRQPGVLPL